MLPPKAVATPFGCMMPRTVNVLGPRAVTSVT